MQAVNVCVSVYLMITVMLYLYMSMILIPPLTVERCMSLKTGVDLAKPLFDVFMKGPDKMKRNNNKLDELLQYIPENKRSIAERLISELEFMTDTLTGLKAIIREKGAEEEFCNGKQHFTRERPAMNSYTKLIARYSTLYKQVCDLMNNSPEAKTELMKFLEK